MPTERSADDQIEQGAVRELDVGRQLPNADAGAVIQKLLFEPDFIEADRRQALYIADEHHVAYKVLRRPIAMNLVGTDVEGRPLPTQRRFEISLHDKLEQACIGETLLQTA